MAKVMIVGGHGKVALLATPLLVAAGHRVTSIIRHRDQAAEVADLGAEPLVADVETIDTEEFAGLLQGEETVIWSAGAGGGNPARTRAVDRDAAIRSMDAAQAAGIGHYVMVSYFGSRPDHGVPADSSFFPYAEAKAAADAHLRAGELAWTILLPSRLTLEEPSGRIDPAPGAAGAVSRGNVAEVIAAVVSRGPAGTARVDLAFNDGEVPIRRAVGALRPGR